MDQLTVEQAELYVTKARDEQEYEATLIAGKLAEFIGPALGLRQVMG